MILFPDVQVKAQAQIDRVVGHDRFPDFSDQPNMPYIAAICKEVHKMFNVLCSEAKLTLAQALRWRTGVPLCESCFYWNFNQVTNKTFHG